MNSSFGMDPIPGMGGQTDGPRFSPATACIRIVDGPGKGQEFHLSGMQMLLGRSDPPNVNVDIDLTECEKGDIPMVSRRHAEFQWVNGDLHLTDMGSANGTRVNGKELVRKGDRQPSDPVILKAGDRIVFANLEVEVATVG